MQTAELPAQAEVAQAVTLEQSRRWLEEARSLWRDPPESTLSLGLRPSCCPLWGRHGCVPKLDQRRRLASEGAAPAATIVAAFAAGRSRAVPSDVPLLLALQHERLESRWLDDLQCDRPVSHGRRHLLEQIAHVRQTHHHARDLDRLVERAGIHVVFHGERRKRLLPRVVGHNHGHRTCTLQLARFDCERAAAAHDQRDGATHLVGVRELLAICARRVHAGERACGRHGLARAKDRQRAHTAALGAVPREEGAVHELLSCLMRVAWLEGIFRWKSFETLCNSIHSVSKSF